MNEVGLNNWRISPLLSRVCDIKTIREEEKGWVRALKPGLNSYSPVTDKKEYMAAYYENNKGTRRFYCGVCEIACESKRGLKRHLDTLKHSYAYMNSVD